VDEWGGWGYADVWVQEGLNGSLGGSCLVLESAMHSHGAFGWRNFDEDLEIMMPADENIRHRGSRVF
jgi:hypothetical protein